MNLLLSFMILTAAPEASIEGRYPEATEIFRCTFDENWDRDYDGWPDRWTRRQGPGFPHYIKIAIDPAPAPGGRAVAIELDGGAGVAYSPPVPIGPLYDYVLEGSIQTDGLQNDVAYFSITLLDEKQQRLEVFASEKVRGTTSWKKIRLGPISPGSNRARFAVVGVHLQPGARSDLKGAARFADLWLGRLPRMNLSSDRGYHVLTDPTSITIYCKISGFNRPAPTIDFELCDVFGKVLSKAKQDLRTQRALDSTGQTEEVGSGEPSSLTGMAEWSPSLPGVGFYRVRAAMVGEHAIVHRRELTLVVLQPDHRPTGGEFGWSLPRGDRPLPLPLLTQLLTHAGVNWIKYPLWQSVQAPDEKTQEVLGFIERLSFHGIETVGMLDRPPDDVPVPFDESKASSIADLFSLAKEVWYPSLEATLSRCGTQVHWWQLGHDKDTSFIGYPRLTEKLSQIKAEMDRVGYDVNLGLGWGWMHPLPQVPPKKRPWRFMALSTDPPLTEHELGVYLGAAKSPELRRWVVLEPLARSEYSVSDRALDLVQRMMAAKIEGAEAIFIPDPFSNERGLMNDDGTPGELFLPWRTTALMLGGAEPVGSLVLPHGSTNRVFARVNDAVMVVWNRKPVKETLYLGENVRQVDLWGHELPIQKTEAGQVIEVGPQPTFLVGVNRALALWQRNFVLNAERLPSVFNQRHRNRYELKNTFPQGVEGSVALVPPDGWQVQPPRTTFRLAVNEGTQQQFEVTLPSSSGSGPQTLRADFELLADRLYRFSVYRTIQIGMGDVRIEVSTQLNNEGELEVYQRMINDSATPVSFRCQLFAPDRRRLTLQVSGLMRGHDLKTYRLPNGKDLIGKTLWLQAEEIDGPRVLNYRFVAEE